MVLGWGKKTMAKQDEEDMTMDEILASIRRYVTEDQNATPDNDASRSQQYGQSEAARFEPSLPSQPKSDLAASPSRETNYEAPYTSNDLLRDQSVMSENPLSSSHQTLREAEREETPSISQSLHDHHSSHSPLSEFSREQGVSEESTISAAARALSKLAAIESERRPSAGGPSLTLDALIADLARPMIKSWLDENLSQIVEDMVQQEIERIRNYSLKK